MSEDIAAVEEDIKVDPEADGGVDTPAVETKVEPNVDKPIEPNPYNLATLTSEEQISILSAELANSTRRVERMERLFTSQHKLLQDKEVLDDDDVKKMRAGLDEDDADANKRIESLNTILGATQAVHPDIAEVVSQNNFDIALNTLSSNYTKEQGGSFLENRQAIEKEIWNMPNPYLYMRGVISGMGIHTSPAPTKPQSAKDVVGKSSETPVSIALTAGAGTGGQSGLSAKVIDAMSEVERNKLPDTVIEKWLHGDLD